MPNRIADAIAASEKHIAKQLAEKKITKAKIEEMRAVLNMDCLEHAKFQEHKSLAVATGVLTTDEGMTVYNLLGGTVTVYNRRSLAEKSILYTLYMQMLKASLDRSKVKS